MFEHNPKALAGIAREVEKAMMDDVDRSCCQSVKRLLNSALADSDRWSIEKTDFHDPGFTIVLKHIEQFSEAKDSNPRVTVEITYGDKNR